MTDIVERLGRQARRNDMPYAGIAAMEDAAAEIRRLREQLRVAREALAFPYVDPGKPPHDNPNPAALCLVRRKYITRVNAALTQLEGTDG